MNTRQHEPASGRTDQLALGLGWFSVALGVAEIAAPRQMARFVGAPDTDGAETVVRTLGTRNVANGIAILTRPDKARWLWTQAAGDAIDLSLIGAAFVANDRDRPRLCAASTAVLGIAALDLLCAAALRRHPATNGHTGSVRIDEVVTINRSIEEVYAFWRRFENLPRFMRHLESVEQVSAERSFWRAVAPAGRTVEWEAEIVQDRPNEWIAWRSLEGADVENSGSVTFRRAPGARGTELRVHLQYRPPAGKLGRGIAWLSGEKPGQQFRHDLRRLKQMMETGEIPASDSPGLGYAARPPAGDHGRVPTGAAR